MNSRPALRNRLTSRLIFASSTMGIVSTFLQVSWFIFHARGVPELRPLKYAIGFYWPCIPILFCLLVLWFLSISGRLHDLRISRMWISAYAALWTLSLFAIVWGNPCELMAALFLAIITQLPLMVLPSRRVLEVPPSVQLPR
jgi:hypothetical protein